MNSSPIPSNGNAKTPVQPDWKKQFEEWRLLLERCGRKPNRRRVHALRVSTLRLKAEIDFWLLDLESDDPLGDAAKAWNKQADKVRQALSPVRDADVLVEMLKKLRTANGSAGEESRLTPAHILQVDELERRFQQKRRSAEKDLLAEIEDRRARLERASKKLQDDLTKRSVWAGNDRARLIRRIIAGLASEVQTLTPDTLHEFRKRAKTARYLADMAAKNDPHAARQAALLKRMQNAAGKWHDLQTLAASASDISKSDEDGLVEILETLAQQSLKNALDACRRLTRQLLAQGAQNGASGKAFPLKKPVRGIVSADLAAEIRRTSVK